MEKGSRFCAVGVAFLVAVPLFFPRIVCVAGEQPATGVVAVNLDFEQGGEGWRMKNAYSVRKGAGMNGTAALVYENADPNLPYAFPSQKVVLKKGEIYRFSAWIRTENLVPASGGGAMLAIEWSDGERHLGGSYSKALKGTHDWTRIEGVTTVIPDKAVNMSFIPYCTPGSVGKAYFDDIEVVPYEKPAVGHMLSSFYRNTAAKGVAEFRVVLAVPERYALADLKAEFSYAETDGSRKTVKATMLARDSAGFSVPVSSLKMGESIVAFRLKVPDGSTLGATKLAFKRVAKMPERRVWIDEHNRTIVDGKPFFPLGMYTGNANRRDVYVKGPFNCIMSYQAPDAAGMDFYWANGVRVIYSVKDVYAGAGHAPKSVTTEAEADAFVQAKVDEFKDHPGLLAWYVNDELVGDSWFGPLAHRRDFLEKADPDHPTWAVIYQLQFLRDIIPTFDVIGTDPYPVPDKPLSYVTDWTRTTNRAYFGLRPMWQVPQAFDWGGYRDEWPGSSPNRMPTVDEMRSMAWQCVASGANGIIFYSFTAIQKQTHGLPFEKAWADICKVGEEIREYLPVLLSVEPAPTVKGAPAEWGVRIWRKGGEAWLLVVNAQDKASKAELSFSEAFASVSAEFGPAAAKSGARTLSVSLAPNEPAFYRIR